MGRQVKKLTRRVKIQDKTEAINSAITDALPKERRFHTIVNNIKKGFGISEERAIRMVLANYTERIVKEANLNL